MGCAWSRLDKSDNKQWAKATNTHPSLARRVSLIEYHLVEHAIRAEMSFAATRINDKFNNQSNEKQSLLFQFLQMQIKKGKMEVDDEAKEIWEKYVEADLTYNSASPVETILKIPRGEYATFKSPEVDLRAAYAIVAEEEKADIQRRLNANPAADIKPSDFREVRISTEEGVTFFRHFDGSISDEPMVFQGFMDPVKMVDPHVVKEEVTGECLVHKTLVNLIRHAKHMGCTRAQLDKMFLLFVQRFMPVHHGPIRDLKGENLFEAILGLASHTTIIQKILDKLAKVTREPTMGVMNPLAHVKNLCMELSRLTTPNMSETALDRKIESIMKTCIPKLISPAAKADLNMWLSSYRTKFNRDATLAERIAHVDELENIEKYRLTEPVTVKDSQMSTQLYFSKLCGGTPVEELQMARDLAETNDEVLGMSYVNGQLCQSEVFMTNAYYGESTPQARQATPWGAGARSLPPLSSSSSEAGVTTGFGNGTTVASVYGAPSNTASNAPSGVPPTSITGQSSGWRSEESSGYQSSGAGTHRGRSTQRNSTWKTNPSVSPASGKERIYLRTNSGNFRSINRSDMMVRRGSKGALVPRGASPSPGRSSATRSPSPAAGYGQYKTPQAALADGRCPRCFIYLKSRYGYRCSETKCRRYGSCAIGASDGSGLCSCKGGYHPKALCSRAGIPGTPSRPTSPGQTFNTKLGGN